MSNFLPAIGAAGIYTLLAPYDKELIADTSYTCTAIRRLADIIAAGGNPLNTYYLTKSLTADVYTQDVANDVCIVSLQSPGGKVVSVPSSYIKSFPDIGGVPYSVIALAISLGAIPVSMDLTYLKSQVVDLVRDSVGIDSEVNEVEIAAPSLVSYDDSKALEAARKANIAIVKTDRAMYLETLALLEKAQQKIKLLESHIKATKQ